ncbi:MAG: hypothetical protein A2Z88_08470 [Omnitrophica WOR_2 bacterium GWA2_47_8]|nr:MAG: hypothetical protein A2Z88_08470 [Omnitrophica WOR_2 bacterium GWA2_47_8]
MDITKVAVKNNQGGRGCLVINYPRLGDAIMSYSAIRSLSLDSQFAGLIVAYPATPVSKSSYFIHHFPFPQQYKEFDPNWYAFSEENWGKITDFMRMERIMTVVNLQNEGPLYDKDYYRFKEVYAGQFNFWELDSYQIYHGARKIHLLESTKKMFEVRNVQWWYPPRRTFQEMRRGNVIFFVGSNEANKRWGVKQWIRVIRQLSSKYRNEKFLVLSGVSRQEREEINHIHDGIANLPNVSVVGPETLDESFERIGKSKFVISHDTYPIHLASLLSIPVLGIYFSTDPVIWGSYLNEYKYISSPLACFGRKQGTGNCSHFHTTCPNIDEIKKSITVEQVVFEGVRMIEKITQKS